ncbi:MAG: glycosyltransferase [Methanobacterium sp.]|nr:glycosyltransferase [Methanobacterium sp.]
MQRIVILAFNIGEGGGIIAINNLLEILDPITTELHFIGTVDKGRENPFQDLDMDKAFITHKGGGSKLIRFFNIIKTQIRMSYAFLKLVNQVDTAYFMGDTLILPMLISKIFNKNIILSLISSSLQINEALNDSFHEEIKLVTNLNYILSDLILLYSPSLMGAWSLDKYQDKIYIIQEHFLDFHEFKVEKKFNKREKIVGYMGRLSSEKGVMKLIKAIPTIIEILEDIEFIIGGTGPLEEDIRLELKENNLSDRVKLLGWIPEDDFTDQLNDLQLLVIPSQTEGLPYIILESMACGTPVLAANVGSIPDLIIDGKNSFIMEDNSVKSIEENIIRVLECSQLEKIAGEARDFVEKNFNYQAAVEKYKSLLDKLQ